VSIQFSKVIASQSHGKGENFSVQSVNLREVGDLASLIACSTSSAVTDVLGTLKEVFEAVTRRQ
jgi:hypothetical protein